MTVLAVKGGGQKEMSSSGRPVWLISGTGYDEHLVRPNRFRHQGL